jgi:methyl-accepting chemotaxis protein
MSRQIGLSTKMMLLGIAGVVCFSIVLTFVYTRIEARVQENKKTMLKGTTDIAFSLLTEYEARVKSGEFNLEEAQKRAALRTKNLRYNGQEYFWINDLAPKMIMHPFKPELDGKDISGIKDPNGKALFVEFVKVCKEKGEGFVDYMWPKPGKDAPVPKVSFVKVFEPWGWIIGSGVYVDDLQSEMWQVRMLFIGTAVLIGIGLLVLSWLVARNTARPINRAVDGLTQSAEHIASAAGQISYASQQLAEGASEQAAAIEETSASLEEISSMTRKNAENASEADRLMKATNQIVTRANTTMHNLTSSMEDISKASEETQKIIKTIDEIAFQTNLLALNAAVEAARAGESGAGFAVVADEVRNLALRAAEAAKNTGTLIEDTVKKTKVGAGLVQQTNNDFSEVTSMVTKSGGLVGEIAVASTEQAQGIDHLNQAVQEMDKVVQQNAASAEKTASITQDMNVQSEQVNELVIGLAKLVGTRNHSAVESRKAKRRQEKPSDSLSISVQRVLQPHAGSNGMGGNGVQRQPNRLRPEQVIPLDDDMHSF